MGEYDWVTDEMFDDAVRTLAKDDGVDVLLGIPGVWECIAEFYNNDALSLLEERRALEDDEEEPA